MDGNELIDQMLDEEKSPSALALPGAQSTDHATGGAQRAHLAAVAAAGQAQEYLGKQVTAAEVEKMPEEEVAKLDQRYEARLGAAMTRTLGALALQAYALTAGTVLPILKENQLRFVEDLKSDPFIMHTLTIACCELYHCYGIYLVPVTALLTTAKHCRFENPQHDGQSDGGSGGSPSSGS